MTPKTHPLVKTWGFFVCLGLFVALWMSRPEHPLLDLVPFPKWTQVQHSNAAPLNPEAIDTLLAGYASYEPSIPEKLPASVVPDTDSLALTASASQSIQQSQSVHHSNSAVPPYPREIEQIALHPNLQLQGSEAAFNQLARFFHRLHNKQHDGPLHVFHFGDSQIEGDRITHTLRDAWQARWGGYGMGYLAPKPLVAPASIRQSTSPGWNRHARFGRRETTIQHKRFGLLASFASHESSTEAEGESWIRLEPNQRARLAEQQVHSVKMLFGRTDSNARMSCFVDTTLIGTFLLPADSSGSELMVPITTSSGPVVFQSIEFQFEGAVPEVDAIGLMPDSGLVFHNVAMRGSSGTLFRQLDRTQFSRQLQSQDVGMVILQFGGNAVPYIADSAAVERYGQWFASQIRLFQSLIPQAAIVVIGPSDMATKQDQYMVTYPMLVPVRNALRQAAMAENVLFWDVFEVMGGEGSMAAWVASEPKLASSDHVHFTRRGAKKIASFLVQSLDAEWAVWHMNQDSNPLAAPLP